jgi:hypothetical protein
MWNCCKVTLQPEYLVKAVLVHAAADLHFVTGLKTCWCERDNGGEACVKIHTVVGICADVSN